MILILDGGFGGSVKEFIDDFKKNDASKYNSISFGNGADGGYSVYIGVDAKNRIRKIFADATVAEYAQHPKVRQSYLSWWWDKEDYNDQFFGKLKENRIKFFVKVVNFTKFTFIKQFTK